MGRVGGIDGDGLTLKQFDGTELSVVISPSATVTAPVPATLRDMARGDSITVRGSVGADGDVVAYQVQEAPSAGYFGPPGSGGTRREASGRPRTPVPSSSPEPVDGSSDQCGSQASGSAASLRTPAGSLPSMMLASVTFSRTIRSAERVAIQTSWRCSAGAW